MIDQPSASQWAELRKARPQSEDCLTVQQIQVEGKPSGLQMAIDYTGRLHLLIALQTAAGRVEDLPPDLNGLTVRHRKLASGDVLDLSAPPSHEPVFTPFCREIVDALFIQKRDPWRAVAAVVRAWQSAWRPVRAEMDKAKQTGLLGELLVLQHLLLPNLGADAVYQWSGPESARHDFTSARLDIEVKTTRKSAPEHEISRLDQLCPPPDGQLLFVSVRVEESAAGNVSLAAYYDQIIDALRPHPAALDCFMSKMFRMGWSEELRRSCNLLKFIVHDVGLFMVDEDFPRLPDDFKPPPGVISVKYCISLANLPSLDRDEAADIIRQANPL